MPTAGLTPNKKTDTNIVGTKQTQMQIRIMALHYTPTANRRKLRDMCTTS